MDAHYLDASALAKRYLEEAGSPIVSGLIESANSIILSSQLCPIEVYSALSRRRNERFLSPDLFQRAVTALETDISHRIFLAEVSSEILIFAKALIVKHGVRAGDSIHLATAFTLNGPPLIATEDQLVFVGSDQALLNAALAEGFRVMNPAVA